MKICYICKIPKPKRNFLKDRRSADGMRGKCRACESECGKGWQRRNRAKAKINRRKWVVNNPEKVRAGIKKWSAKNPGKIFQHRLKTHYGLSTEDFNKLLAHQGGRCAICIKPFTDTKNRHVDHCHKTSRNRGILCSNCNFGLGQFKDSPERLRAAAIYLENS